MQQIVVFHVTYTIGGVFYWCTTNIVYVVCFLLCGNVVMNISGSVMQQCNQWVKRPAMVFISPLELNYGYLALLGP